ncbi:hypothetical protein LIER_10004 [Lithospermum erythrorhizon]|uniref:Uncharacterized protein n=1 Tax=Lithospermum erythrorhizon TaxID=34254 RepID=A0AAV3PHU2_LITER
MMEPWPTVSKAYAMVSRVEKKGSVSTIMNFLEVANGNSALYVKPYVDNKKSLKKWEENKSFLRCDYCVMKGHTKDTCFKLKGYPEGFFNMNQKIREMTKMRESSQANNATNSSKLIKFFTLCRVGRTNNLGVYPLKRKDSMCRMETLSRI